MRVNAHQIKQALKSGKIEKLFKEELGWDRLSETPPELDYKGRLYKFTPLAQKRGFKIYQHIFNGNIPEDQFLYQLDRKLNDFAIEHITIFLDASGENQAWLWVKREQENNKVRSKPLLRHFNKQQSGNLLALRLESLFVTVDEEESVTLTTILDRVRQGFDVESVTKIFFGLFEKKHADFLKSIENIPHDDEHKGDLEWYTSIMLNRLMFIYFIQKKGLLDNRSAVSLEGNKNYLYERLLMTQQAHGPDSFYAFYRYFLRRLFHEGLNQPEFNHSSELKHIIGNVPYINGGLFDVHVLEQRYPDIKIKDEAFKQVFDFFEQFEWYLDNRPMRNDKEINPDVLGYIFEKYINQKQMGAYYTKEDITEYISKNTVIPFIFEKVASYYPNAFGVNGSIWSLLKDHPSEYIYNAMTHGILEPLPPEIEVGITNVAQRTLWNQSAEEQWALPTETWREVVERRQHYNEIHTKMSKGEISAINDLITYNLDIIQFANDVIGVCEEPDMLDAFYNAIEQVTVLDPTCGSGAFLFAALNILKPLYAACIENMRRLVARHKESNHIRAFQSILKHIQSHQSQEYFILKSIIINNLYGVDIMEEAIEICKLRLFLKLVAQIEKPDDLEPLPDIDFNILAGNTLIGFTSIDEVRRVVTAKLITVDNTEKTLQLIEREAQAIERDEQNFRDTQTDIGIKIDPTAKLQLREKLENLRGKLNPYLATEHGIYESKYFDKAAYENAYAQWKKHYKPFHWWAEFNKIMQSGGFDVIIGNPPYVEYGEKMKKQYKLLDYMTLSCGNLHSYVSERILLRLARREGYIGLIVPLPSINTIRMEKLQSLIKPPLIGEGRTLYVTAFDERPSNLFVGVDQRLAIEVFSSVMSKPRLATTGINRWMSSARNMLFATIVYTVQSSQVQQLTQSILKIKNSTLETRMLHSFYTNRTLELYKLEKKTANILAYRTAGGRYWKVTLDHPFDSHSLSNKIAYLRDLTGQQAVALVSSSTFWWYYSCYFDMYNLKDYMIFGFRFSNASIETLLQLQGLGIELIASLERNSTVETIKSKTRGEVTSRYYIANKSKPIINKIDNVLAQHYGFTPEELDFIINYDIKYRMGRNNGEESEE